MDVRVVRNLAPERADELADLYDTWDWWADRDADAVARAIENSTVVVGLELAEESDRDGDLVASARVVSDGVYYARLYDVVVHEDYRGEGLGERLVRETVEHPKLSDLDAITLGCEPDLVDFYEDCGFEDPPIDFRQLNYEN